MSRFRPFPLLFSPGDGGSSPLSREAGKGQRESADATNKARVFVVDGYPIVRDGLGLLINSQPDLLVCGEAADAPTALATLDSTRPDLLLVDISLSGPDGLELVKTVRARSASLPILIFSMHDETVYAERSLQAGANGYLMKQEATDRVLAAIRCVLRGDVYLSDRVSSRLVRQHVGRPTGAGDGQARPALAALSDRELEVFRLIGQGHPTRDIAADLGLSVKTVETHQAHIKEKLSLRGGRELVQYAIEWHLTEDSPNKSR